MHPPSEVAGICKPIHRGLGTGRTIGFDDPDGRRGGQSQPSMASAAAAGSPAGAGGEWRHRPLAISRVQGRHVGATGGPPQQGQGLNPPGDDQVHGQGRFRSRVLSCKGFHPANRF